MIKNPFVFTQLLGNCGTKGESCMTVEMSLENDVTAPGAVGLSLIPPYVGFV